MNHIKYRIFGISVLFLVLIFFPKINTYLKLVKDIENFENRSLTNKPDLKTTTLEEYPGRYENFFNDNFSVRSILMNSFNYYNFVCLKKSPVPDKLLIGRDNWLYSAGNEIDSYTGRNSLRNGELDSLKKEFEYRSNYLQKKNIKFYFFVAPEKAVIHPEHLPHNIYKISESSWANQLFNFLNKHSNVKTINVFNHLIEQKNKHNIYYRNDNHWNKFGAFYSYQFICNEINKDFGDIKPISENDIIIKDTIKPDGNLSNMLGNLNVIPKDSEAVITIKNGYKAIKEENKGYKPPAGFPYPWEFETRKQNPGKPHKILIISDSFGGNLFPFMAESFGSTIKIWDSWQYKLNEDIIEKENPDIVLLVVHESLLRNILGNSQYFKNKKGEN